MCSTHSMNSEKSSKRRKVEYHCEYCDKSYKKSAKLENMYHLIQANDHTNAPMKAVIKPTWDGCVAAFSTRQHLQRHEKIRNSPTIFCDYPGCSAEFTKRFQLRWHRATHEKGTHECKQCTSVFDSLPALEKHIDRVHENPVIYNCGLCDNKFTKWTKLREHTLKDHPIQCTVCDKTYTRKGNLRQHIKEKHMGQETIKCDWPGCDSTLQTKRSYKTHVALVHEQDIRYKCDLCEKGFPYESMLERHKAFHIPKSNSPSPARQKKSIAEKITGFSLTPKTEDFECPFSDCYYKFPNTYLLRRHLKGANHAEDVRSFELLKKAQEAA
ncbi:unnamed protein product [Mucor hiemalis]